MTQKTTQQSFNEIKKEFGLIEKIIIYANKDTRKSCEEIKKLLDKSKPEYKP